MQLIGANSEAAARASVRQREGGVSGCVREISDRILALLALIEASDDFPDEVEEQAAAPEVAQGLREIIAELDRRCDPRAARLIREGASIVLAGRPNVGKSSLMNALLHQERAIVTSVPGTTRDVLTERLTLGGVRAELSDTAGRRETDDPVERIGVDRAKQAAERADVKLIVLDASRPLDAEDALLLETADERAIVCLNKADMPKALSEAEVRAHTSAEIIELSARTGAGIETLLSALEARLTQFSAEDKLTVERHIALAQRARSALSDALETLAENYPLDMAALDLRAALTALSQITTLDPTDSLLTAIFSTFCVGK